MATAKPRERKRPTSGPGSRQPLLTLTPLGDPPGHPLVHLMEHKLRKGDSVATLAASMDVMPHSLYKWLRACKADPHFPLPLLRAKQLAGYFRVKPDTFRPDFPWSNK